MLADAGAGSQRLPTDCPRYTISMTTQAMTDYYAS